jgi:hypothetical protein
VAGTGTQSPSVTVTAPAHTALTASTESNDLNINLARTAQFATGTLATQRAIRVQAPTYSFVAASTLTTATTVQIDSAPVAGTNATLTSAYALRVLTGTTTGVGIVIQGATSQTGDLFQIQNSTPTTLLAPRLSQCSEVEIISSQITAYQFKCVCLGPVPLLKDWVSPKNPQPKSKIFLPFTLRQSSGQALIGISLVQIPL